MVVSIAFVMITFFAGMKIGQDQAAAVEVTCFCEQGEYEEQCDEITP